jgi:tetratricopeptide (TPR) repeat protein
MSPAIETTRRGRVWMAPLLIALLAGCASKGPGPAAESGPPPAATPDKTAAQEPGTALPVFQQQHQAAAQAAEQRGQWTQALWHLDVLLALAPADADLQRRHANAQQAAQRAAADVQQRARQARARGDHESATRFFLEVLSLAPGDAEAAEALRALERERVKRQHLGLLSRNTLNRRMGAEPPIASNTTPAATSGGADRNELEHASLLAGQGEVEGAIAVLRPLVTSRRADPAVRRMLADLYVRQADALLPDRREAAVAALERAVQADPTHARAAARLKEVSGSAPTQGTKSVPTKPARPAAR